jgi:CO/xanthine dehydrogenase FAD-binding subunit
MIIEYHRPETIDEALALLARENPITVPMGGGSVLSQKRTPDFAVVDLQRLGLDGITTEGQMVNIGAAATLDQLSQFTALPEKVAAALRVCIEREAGANQRGRATVAGALVSGDGRSSLATALLALDARLVWAPGGDLQALGDFLPLREPFGEGRLMLEIRITSNPELRVEMVSRTPLDKPIVCAAVAIWPSGRTRVALGGHGPAPVLAMDGPEAGGAVLAAQEAFRFSEDQWGSADYRMDVAGKLVGRLVAAMQSVSPG